MIYKVADMFAGVGGFAHAFRLSNLQHEVVWASEIDEGLRDLYEVNFGIRPDGDIKEVDEKALPDFDVLTAGFPCQPFSVANQHTQGDAHPKSELFWDIIRVAEAKRPPYILLENVTALLNKNNTQTLKQIVQSLSGLGYSVHYNVYCPTMFGIPHHRPRVFFMCKLDYPLTIVAPMQYKHVQPLREYLAKCRATCYSDDIEHIPIANSLQYPINIWRDFWYKFRLMDIDFETINGQWLYAEEWGADYPIQKDMRAESFPSYKLVEYNGAFGRPIRDTDDLPRRMQDRIVDDAVVKRAFWNRRFYEKNKKWLSKWRNENYTNIMKSCRTFTKARFKVDTPTDFDDMVMTTYSTGVTFTRGHVAQCLMTKWDRHPQFINESRSLAPREAAYLQGMGLLENIRKGNKGSKDFGNAVNAEVVSYILEALLTGESQWTTQAFLI